MNTQKIKELIKRIFVRFIFWTYPVLVLIILFFIYMDFLDPNSFQKLTARRNQTFKIGIKIVAALEDYHKDFNQYPKDLNEIVPKYIDKIEPATWGDTGWRYISGTGEVFLLQVGFKDGSGIYPRMSYHPRDGWRTDS